MDEMTDPAGTPPGGNDARYSRQVLFAEIGAEGQRRLALGRALVVGCGALGCTIAEILARAGVGRLTIVDRDLVEESNLQRQILFDESDAKALLPKAEAAARRLRAINSRIQIEGIVADLTPATIDRLARRAGVAPAGVTGGQPGGDEGTRVVVDGTDNFETRYLLNEWSVREGVPWIYGAAVGSYGVSLTVLPGQGACLACVFEEAPPPGTTPTCDTAGILAAAAVTIGALEAAEAIKILSGRRDRVSDALSVVDLWEGRFDRLKVARRTDPPCACCGLRRFPALAGELATATTTLCGRNSVQVSPASGTRLDLEELAARLAAVGSVEKNPFLIRARVEGVELTVFGDGRAIVGGTKEPDRARAVYARYIGG